MSQIRRYINWSRRTIVIASATLVLSIITILLVCTIVVVCILLLSKKTPAPESPTSLRSPCQGYFLFVVDVSNKASDPASEVSAIQILTESWKLDDSNDLQVAVMVTALKYYVSGAYMTKFTGNRQRWEGILDVLSNKITEEGSDSPFSPIDIADAISWKYCTTDNKYGMQKDGNIKFVIFSSYSDEDEIPAMSDAHNPWLKCKMAARESIFVISIDSGSPKLNELSYPNRDSFVRMTDFGATEVDYLKNKITLTMCDCKPTSDRRLPDGCPLTIHEPIHPTITSGTTTTQIPALNPCFGYFVFVVDRSMRTDVVFEKVIESVPRNWGVDEKNGTLQLAGAYSHDYGWLACTRFHSSFEGWTNTLALIRYSFGTGGELLTPIDLADLLSWGYCGGNDRFPIEKGGSIKFIIFTSYRNITGIDSALRRQNPWLKCALAGSESIFMVAVDKGSLSLRRLSVPPSDDLFMRMSSFDRSEIQQLTDKIVQKMCH